MECVIVVLVKDWKMRMITVGNLDAIPHNLVRNHLLSRAVLSLIHLCKSYFPNHTISSLRLC